MARKKKHEEHVNAEAWAIPYGDLVTLLLALFVVMYAMSSVNEGKYRILSDSMIAAFRGAPKSISPVNIGDHKPTGGDKKMVGERPTTLMKVAVNNVAQVMAVRNSDLAGKDHAATAGGAQGNDGTGTLVRMEREVQQAMQELIDARLVSVRHENLWLEVEINTDILFPSGAAAFTSKAEPVLDKLAAVLKPFPNHIRVEGHTDDRPIRTAAFPSNWELSAARAATVVHQFTRAGLDPLRLEIVGFGQYHPRKPNTDDEGRNANRRVAILIMEGSVLQNGQPTPATPAPSGAPSVPAIGPGTTAGGAAGTSPEAPPAAAAGPLPKTVLINPVQVERNGAETKPH
jgi:chemotaxis protein MotB